MTIRPEDATAKDFLAWAKTVDPNTEYDYVDVEYCPYAQFLRHLGVAEPSVCPHSWRDLSSRNSFSLPEGVDRNLRYTYSDRETEVRTFGEMVARLEADLEAA